MRLSELVYESLIGESVVPLPGVPNAYEAGSFCENRYEDMSQAYARLRDRLGVVDEDTDVEIIIDALLDIQRELCLRMYELSKRFI